MLGLSYDELYDLTPRSFSNKLLGFNNYQRQLLETSWEQTRLIIHSTLSPHSKKKLRPKEILPFPWDDKNKPRKDIASQEHIQEVLKRYNKNKIKKLN